MGEQRKNKTALLTGPDCSLSLALTVISLMVCTLRVAGKNEWLLQHHTLVRSSTPWKTWQPVPKEREMTVCLLKGDLFFFPQEFFGDLYLVLEEENLHRKVFRNVTSLPLALTMWLEEMIVFSV